MKTEVIKKDVNYDRTGYLILDGDEVVFDTSDEEYGPVIFSLDHLEQMIKEHKEKLNNG